MMIGISSYAYSWASGGIPNQEKPEQILTPIKLAEKASEFGLKVIQFGDNMPLDICSQSEINSLKNFCEEHKISIELGMNGIDAEKISAYAKLAKIFHSRIIRTLIPVRENIDDIISELSSIIPILEENNVMLAIENYEKYSCEDYSKIIEALPEQYFGLCLDTANNLGRGETPEQFVEKMPDRICCLHVKDIAAERLPTKMGFTITGVPAGTGIVNIRELVRAISKRNPNFTVILEQWPPKIKDIKTTLEREEEWVKLSVCYLKALQEEMN